MGAMYIVITYLDGDVTQDLVLRQVEDVTVGALNDLLAV